MHKAQKLKYLKYIYTHTHTHNEHGNLEQLILKTGFALWGKLHCVTSHRPLSYFHVVWVFMWGGGGGSEGVGEKDGGKKLARKTRKSKWVNNSQSLQDTLGDGEGGE